MKLPLHLHALVLCIAAIPDPTRGFSAVKKDRRPSSTFIPSIPSSRPFPPICIGNRRTALMYGASSDPPNNGPGSDESSTFGMWNALAKTEKWITDTLGANSGVSAASQATNPYSRKEVSYVCDISDDNDAIVAGVISRLREMREVGDKHGKVQEKRRLEEGPRFEPKTLRQTLVVVIPESSEFSSSYSAFDDLITAINNARRNARDYVTDVQIEKMEGDSLDWTTSLNMAHLHPEYGMKTKQEMLKEEMAEDDDGEVDLNLKAYKEKRLLARRSPFPTLVIEVKSTPPVPPAEKESISKKRSEEGKEASKEDVQKLESLFGQSAFMNHPTTEEKDEDSFYSALGNQFNDEMVSPVPPLTQAQNWIILNDALYSQSTCSFTLCDTKHVDSAYEFIFANIAMQQAITEHVTEGRTYLVMPQFLSSSATSFQRFSKEVQNIVNVTPRVGDNLAVSTFHPEHVEKENRSPVPIFVLTRKKV